MAVAAVLRVPVAGVQIPQQEISRGIGYSDDELAAVPDGSNLGLGCGNPVALASFKEGDTVLDLGSGAGFDCFLAANKVGKNGKVIGVDMTPEMLERARRNAIQGGYTNVDFRLGEIENLPVADNTVDVAISNCVINLSPDKPQVFKEIFRVLKPGGRLMVSDIVLLKPLPDVIKESVSAYVGCVAGASLKASYLDSIHAAGFKDIEVMSEEAFPVEFVLNDSAVKELIKEADILPEMASDIAGSVISAKISATKPQ